MNPTTPKSLQDLFIFKEVATQQSFRKTAIYYQLSPSAISHSIGQLENQLSVRLFNRSTRKVSLTQAGEQFFKGITPALQQIERAFLEVQSHQVGIQGNIRLTMPKGAEDIMTPLIIDFCNNFPAVHFDIDISDRLRDIIDERYDAGIRFEETLQQDWVALPISHPQQFCVVATPVFLDKYGMPNNPQELINFSCINLRFPSGKIYDWEFSHPQGKLEVKVTGKIITSEMSQAIQFVKNSIGIGYVYHDKVKHELQTGELMQILSQFMPSAEKFYLYYPSRKFHTPVFDMFLQWLKNFDYSV